MQINGDNKDTVTKKQHKHFEIKSEGHMHEIKLERNSNKKGYTNKPQVRQQDF